MSGIYFNLKFIAYPASLMRMLLGAVRYYGSLICFVMSDTKKLQISPFFVNSDLL